MPKKRPPEYTVWQAMKTRCYNKNMHAYPAYGGRGISVCDEWRDDFEQFYKDMGPRPSPVHELDRIDPNGNYCPSNCRWLHISESARNRRNIIRLTHNGVTKTAKQWSDELNIDSSTLWYRLRRGWTIARALETPVNKKRKG